MPSSLPKLLLLPLLSACGVGDPAEPEESKQPTTLETVRSQVQAGREQVDGCYAQAVAARPGLAGKLELELRMEGGRATHLKFAVDEPDDEGLRACVQAAVDTWSFPPMLNEELGLSFAFGSTPPPPG